MCVFDSREGNVLPAEKNNIMAIVVSVCVCVCFDSG